MGLTNQLPSSRLAQAGVIPNAAARPASPYEGQMVYQQDIDKMLFWNGTAWRFMGDSTVQTESAMDSISSWKLADVDFTTSTLVEIENVFSANHDNYEIILTVVGSAAVSHRLLFHTATSTPTSATNYFRYGFYLTAGGTFTNFQSNSENYLFLNNHSTTAGVISSTHAKVINPFLNTSRTHLYHQSYDAQSGLYINLMHQWIDNTRFTGFRVYPTSGTFTGNIQVRGWKA